MDAKKKHRRRELYHTMPENDIILRISAKKKKNLLDCGKLLNNFILILLRISKISI